MVLPMTLRKPILAVSLAVAAAAYAFSASSSLAAEGDAVDGAIWRYKMTRVAGKGIERQGRIRILGTEIFQIDKDGSDTLVGTIAGKFEPPRGEVVVTFDKLRARDAQEMSFKGKLKRNAAGQAEGRLVDGDGFHWNFKAERIRE